MKKIQRIQKHLWWTMSKHGSNKDKERFYQLNHELKKTELQQAFVDSWQSR